MPLQRVVSLVLVVVGFEAGWLARPLGEVPEAEAAKGVTWRCIAPEGPVVTVHNPTGSAASYRAVILDHQGATTVDQPGTPIGARVTHFFASGTPQGGAIIVSSAAPLLVDSQVRADEATRQGACFKGK